MIVCSRHCLPGGESLGLGKRLARHRGNHYRRHRLQWFRWQRCGPYHRRYCRPIRSHLLRTTTRQIWTGICQHSAWSLHTGNKTYIASLSFLFPLSPPSLLSIPPSLALSRPMSPSFPASPLPCLHSSPLFVPQTFIHLFLSYRWMNWSLRWLVAPVLTQHTQQLWVHFSHKLLLSHIVASGMWFKDAHHSPLKTLRRCFIVPVWTYTPPWYSCAEVVLNPFMIRPANLAAGFIFSSLSV